MSDLHQNFIDDSKPNSKERGWKITITREGFWARGCGWPSGEVNEVFYVSETTGEWLNQECGGCRMSGVEFYRDELIESDKIESMTPIEFMLLVHEMMYEIKD